MKKYISMTVAIVLVLAGAFNANVALATTVGPSNPGTRTDVSFTGSDVAWTNVNNASSSNGFYATADLNNGNDSTDYLKATNFGFAIPVGATINGIQVDVLRRETGGVTLRVSDNVVRLVKNGVVSTTTLSNKSVGADWPTTAAYATFGSSTDLWATTWTPADLNASTTGFVISAIHDGSSNNRAAEVDHIRMTVYYTAGGADVTAPVISQVTAVGTPTNDTTPNYTFYTNEAGTITYGGSCSSATTAAPIGTSTVTFNALAQGTYSNCTLKVTDASSNISNILAIPSFTIDTTAPVITVTGLATTTVEAGATYTDAGATGTDNVDVSVTVTTTGSVNTAVLGTTTLTYHATDAAGNVATTKTRSVGVVDTTKPVITLNGTTPVTVERTHAYTELGAVAADFVDGTSTAIASGSVDTNTVGSYVISYNKTDAHGNVATTVTRTVNVVDTTAPVISQTTPVTSPTNNTTPSYSFTTNEAGSITYGGSCSSATVSATVGINTISFNTLTEGVHSDCTITVTDAALNASIALAVSSFTVDTTAPVITVIGANPMTLEGGATYVELGATSTDAVAGTSLATPSGSVNNLVVGSYFITYNATDTAGNIATPVTREVDVVDTTKPIITLTGTSTISVERTHSYTDAGATATDNVDVSITVNTSGSVDVNTVGSYVLTYSATDAHGNSADQVSRTVNVVDTTAPVISQVAPVATPANDTTPSYTFTTDEAGTISYGEGACSSATNSAVIGSNAVTFNTLAEGTYSDCTITVTDSASNASNVLSVPPFTIDLTAPVITVTGTNPVTVEGGSTYTDEGAIAIDAVDATTTVITSGTVNTSVLGTTTITYTSTDTAGNGATSTREVGVVDTTAPELATRSDITAEATSVDGAVVTFTNPVATDIIDQSVSVICTPESGSTFALGTTTVNCSATDASSNTATSSFSVIVVDTTGPAAPTVVSPANNTIITTANQTSIDWTDATDLSSPVSYIYEVGNDSATNPDGSLVTPIYTSGALTTSEIATAGTPEGVYYWHVKAVDALGNVGPWMEVSKITIDNTAPVITVTGTNPVTIEAGSAYTDEGATATDNVDASVEVHTSGTVNNVTVGTSTLTYTATDTAGNEATPVTRDVVVVDTTAPTIASHGTVTVEATSGEGAAVTYISPATNDIVDGTSTAICTPESGSTFALGTTAVNCSATDSSNNTSTSTFDAVVVDTTAPVITIIPNAGPVGLTQNNTYVELGATASDIVDGSVAVNISGTVDSSTLGSYIITYTAVDSHGNGATSTRTVIVVPPDTTVPVITLLGSTPVTVEGTQASNSYTDAGATAYDNINGNMTGAIVTVNPVDTHVVAPYTITYNVTDGAGNHAVEVTRNVNVVDTTTPVITLNGGDVSLHTGDTYTEAGAQVTDNIDATTTAVVGGDEVTTTAPATFHVTYNYTDAHGNVAEQVTRTVTVVDIAVPVITLTGNGDINVEVNSTYADEGATATDDVDGDITASIVTVNTVNTAALGDYTVTYNVTDSSSNAAVTITRNVHVVDTQAPVITITGANPVNLIVGDTYEDAGATASDIFEGNVSVIATSTVNTNVAGTYQVTYTAEDSSHNSTSTIRTVNVRALGTDASLSNLTISAGEGPALSPVFSSTTLAYTVTLPLGSTETPDATPTLSDSNAHFVVTPATDITSTSTANRTTTIVVTAEDATTTQTYTIVFNVSPAPDTTAPVITITGSATVNLTVGNSYTDAGATALDNIDGDISEAIVASSTVNTSVAGTYHVVYTVQDAAHNEAIATRTVIVSNPENSGGGGGGGGFISGGGFTGTGSVLGTSTTQGGIFGTSTATSTATTTGQVLGAEIFKFNNNLRFGMHNDDVLQLQIRLYVEGFFKVIPTGYFGPVTLQAVKDYQKAHGIPFITGFCGPLTRAELNK